MIMNGMNGLNGLGEGDNQDPGAQGQTRRSRIVAEWLSGPVAEHKLPRTTSQYRTTSPSEVGTGTALLARIVWRRVINPAYEMFQAKREARS